MSLRVNGLTSSQYLRLQHSRPNNESLQREHNVGYAATQCLSEKLTDVGRY
jgi:hypothetical protein